MGIFLNPPPNFLDRLNGPKKGQFFFKDFGKVADSLMKKVIIMVLYLMNTSSIGRVRVGAFEGAVHHYWFASVGVPKCDLCFFRKISISEHAHLLATFSDNF